MNAVLSSLEFEQMFHFSAQIARPIGNIRANIQEHLANYFGYDETIFWFADDNGNLRDPINYRLSDQALFEYLDEYHHHDFLHPRKNVDLFRRKKAIRLADIVNDEQFKESPFYSFMESYGYLDEMVVALIYEGSFVGVLGIAQKKERHPFTEKDRIRFQYLSDIMASCLMHQLKGEEVYPLLSKREAQVAKLVKDGCTNKEVADGLYISTNTVKRHLQNIYQKYKVKNRTQLVKML